VIVAVKDPAELKPVVSEPMLGQRGSSLFDDCALYWLAEVRPIDLSRGPLYVSWEIGQSVAVLDPARCGRGGRRIGDHSDPE
jgi:hypothetical protein